VIGAHCDYDDSDQDVAAVGEAAARVDDDMRCPHCKPSWQALV